MDGGAVGLTIHPYTADDAADWNAFVAGSKNGTFLFDRRYMDYHADRFPDRSLIARGEDGRILALLPATVRGDSLVSHAGLTYGGVVCGRAMTAGTMLALFDGLLAHLRREGFRSLRYKAVPHIYHAFPAEEDLYALFRHGAALVRLDVSTTIDIAAAVPWSRPRLGGLSKAIKAGVTVAESGDHAGFVAMLAARLEERHGARPTHSAEELALLASRFPDRIRLFGAFHGGTMTGGIVVYDCGGTVHTQYMATTAEGRAHGALDLIVRHLLDLFRDRRFFDFGISTEEGGRRLNEGLSRQKEMFGGRTTTYATYDLLL